MNYCHIFGSTSNEPIIRLADRILTLFRDRAGAGHLARVFFGCSGSDANDTNVKLVRYYNNLRGRPAKKKIISRLGGYHGLTRVAGEPDRNFCLPQGLGPAAGRHPPYQLPALVPIRPAGRERGRVL